jgi:hypothetical protein
MENNLHCPEKAWISGQFNHIAAFALNDALLSLI